MEHWKKLFNPHYMGEWDFAAGEEKPLIITDITQEQVFNQRTQQVEIVPVLHFSGEKPLIINRTNAKTISTLYNEPNWQNWKGKGVLLHVQKIKAFGELTGAVRIRPVKPFFCADCGGIIAGYGGKSHQEVRDGTLKTYKRQLCANCAKKAKEAEEQRGA